MEAALDRDFRLEADGPRSDGYYACYMMHSRRTGTLERVDFSPTIERHIVEHNVYLAPGSEVEPFRTAKAAIGNVILRFSTHEDMLTTIATMDRHCVPVLQR